MPSILEGVDRDLLPLLNSVLPLELEETQKTRQMSPQIKSEATHSLLVKLVAKIAPPGTLIVLENAHWY
jgi:hypothetical protein